jgi:hypothetical protein
MVIMGAGERTSISGFPNPTRRFRYRVPKALLGWWGELHPGSTLQLQLPFVIKRPADSGVGNGRQRLRRNANAFSRPARATRLRKCKADRTGHSLTTAPL